jgi:hypothetical protein
MHATDVHSHQENTSVASRSRIFQADVQQWAEKQVQRTYTGAKLIEGKT